MTEGRQTAAEAEFASFCAVQHPRLVGALTLYARDRELAHDLAQETLARIWRDWSKLERIESVEAYAYRTAINLANSHFRWRAVRQRYRHRLELDRDVVHHDPDGAMAVELRRELGALAPRKRLTLVLRYYADLSVATTAEVMQVPQNTVKTLTRRALADLRHVLEVQDTEEEHDVR